jgi:hypothetical protein
VKIKDEGYTLTDVPGQEYIRVEPRDTTGGTDVVIVIKDEAVTSHPRAWTLDALQEYIGALQCAVSLGYKIVNEQPDRAS